jgi:hypothetical protein
MRSVISVVQWTAVVQTTVSALLAAALFAFSFIFRFNDPGGSFAGLTDDHFFYAVRGWQILFGDLPVRDFVDHGAPLHYYVAAAVQAIGGRGTLSELVFCALALSAGAAATCLLAARASGSLAVGALAGLAQILLEPRFYNYPKIVVYAAAIPALWAFADRPTAFRRFLVAAVIAVGFLFRHDHGVFVTGSMAVLVALLRGIPWRQRLRHIAVCGALALALLAPYLVFVQVNGGLAPYLSQAFAWAAHDRQRAGVEWPSLWGESVGDAQSAGVVALLRENRVAWLYYVELAIPLLALVVLASTPGVARSGWPQAQAKIGAVAVLGMLLNAGFLRSPLEARLADPSVPHLVALAWLCGLTGRLLFRREPFWRWPPRRMAAVAGLLLLAVAMAGVVGVTLTAGLGARLRNAALTEGIDLAQVRAERVREALGATWPLEAWVSREQPGVLRLTYYLRDCTSPGDRVLVQDYLPQVIALAQRGFAGGHADLRPGFFETPEAQRLVIERLRRQSVPVVVLGGADDYGAFRFSFPIVAAYLDERYEVIGDRALDDRFAVTVLASRSAAPTGRYAPLDLPCFR